MTTTNRTARHYPYPVVLYFTRLFTAGTLEGLTHDDSIGFMSVEDAESWVAKINAKNAKNPRTMPYLIQSFGVSIRGAK